VAAFDEPRSTSDAGALLLKAVDERLGLTAGIADCIYDLRRSGSVRHEISELLRQRVFALACGYADCNDAGRLAHDPMHKLLVGRDPVDGDALASQPTLSRFENSLGPLTLYRMGATLADLVIEQHRRRLRGRARCITIDLDPTVDPTHGAQQLGLFNGFYDSWCYLPMLGFISFDREPEQYLCAAVLRPGNASDKLGAVPILRRLIEYLRVAFPKARLRVRLDAGFASPKIFDFLDAQPRLDYVVGMPKNAVLLRRTRGLMAQARRLSKKSGVTEHVYGECTYEAESWPEKRRVIVKAEVVRHPGRKPKDNPRFLVTNLKQSPRWIYRHVYSDRGDSENRIKELKLGLEVDRTSCTSFLANQFRVLLTATAYVLMQGLRLHAKNTGHARAQVSTLRDHILKIGARVTASARRLVLHLPATFPYQDAWRRIALSLGAAIG
jgi:hypothetical protein